MPDMLTILIIVSLFAGAWVVSRAAAFVARRILVWQDRRNEAAAATIGARINEIKRRETTVAMIRAALAYGAFVVAAVFSVAQLTGGVSHLGAIAGVSFMLILVGFSVQRVLMDVIAGLMMFIEGWYHVGAQMGREPGNDQRPVPPRRGRRRFALLDIQDQSRRCGARLPRVWSLSRQGG
jgi:small-conductance mechanosensitive channel